MLQRNYLDVYTYDWWESSQQLPAFVVGETFEPVEATLCDGQTAPPNHMTEPELIALMDANGIGTDATMAEHIAKIKEREYITTLPRSGAGTSGTGTTAAMTTSRGRGGGAQGRSRGRGGRSRNTDATATATTSSSSSSPSHSSSGVDYLLPSTLGCALIEAYDRVGLDASLGKPFLRRDMEARMRAICAGEATRVDVVRDVLEQFRDVFVRVEGRVDVLRGTVARLCGGEGGVVGGWLVDGVGMVWGWECKGRGNEEGKYRVFVNLLDKVEMIDGLARLECE